jgi:hypothetical protein
MLGSPISVSVCERDWILLRARLRCFVELSALPRMRAPKQEHASGS